MKRGASWFPAGLYFSKMFNICRIFLYGLPCDIFAPPWYNKDAGSLPALDGTERRRSSAFFRLPGAGYKTPACCESAACRERDTKHRLEKAGSVIR